MMQFIKTKHVKKCYCYIGSNKRTVQIFQNFIQFFYNSVDPDQLASNEVS